MKFNKNFYKSRGFWCFIAFLVIYFAFGNYEKPIWYSVLYFLFAGLMLYDVLFIR